MHPHGSLQPSVTSVLEFLMSSSSLISSKINKSQKNLKKMQFSNLERMKIPLEFTVRVFRRGISIFETSMWKTHLTLNFVGASYKDIHKHGVVITGQTIRRENLTKAICFLHAGLRTAIFLNSPVRAIKNEGVGTRRKVCKTQNPLNIK